VIQKGYWGDLTLITEELLMNRISFDYFLKRFGECVNQENLRNVAVRMLFDFDRYLENREEYPALKLESENFSGEVYWFGPLNKADSVYHFYLMPDWHYFKDIENHNMRFLDQSEFSQVDERIKNYKILKKERLDKNVKIKYYAGACGIQKTYPELRIGIVPVAKELWCNVTYEEYDKEDKYFFQLADKEEYSEAINNTYIRILRKCMENHIQIVIFPELSRNKETEKVIRKFLAQETLKGSDNPLELIFMGSLWENGKNEGILLSGTGTILLRSQKVNKFFLKRNGKRYWEDLQEESQEIQMIDIPGMGRIQYLICKDGLDSGTQHYLWGAFGVAMTFISSYSESVSYFTDLGNDFSTQYAGILCTEVIACAARMERDGRGKIKNPKVEIGHVIVPVAGIDGRGTSCKKVYAPVSHCGNGCSFGGCIRVLHVDPQAILERKTKLQNYIKVSRILL